MADAIDTVTCALEIISRLVHHKTSPLGTFHFRRPEAHIPGARQDEYYSEAQPPKPYLPLTETTRRLVYLNSAAESSLNSGENRRKAVIILNSFQWHLSFEALTTSFSNFGDLHDQPLVCCSPPPQAGSWCISLSLHDQHKLILIS